MLEKSNRRDVVGDQRVRTTIGKNVEAKINIARKILLAATIRKDSKVNLPKQDLKAYT
jgi:hypothetical protein